jgi:hypothetical protein
LYSEIYKVQITDILLLPDNEFLSILVSLEDLYGMNLSESFKASSDITFPKADKEVLINLAYLSLRSLDKLKALR